MSATSRLSGFCGCCPAVARKLGGMESPMVELSQSFSDMPARRAAASALSRTDGSMPSTLHDTREFILSPGFDSGAPPAPSASPRVPQKRQSNSAQVVCLWHRLFRVTVNNRLRNRQLALKVAVRANLAGFGQWGSPSALGQDVAMAADSCLGLLEPSKVHFWN